MTSFLLLVGLLLGVALLVAAGYFFVFLGAVPEVARQRFGEPEPMPDHLGEWRVTGDADGLVREERIWLDTGRGFGGALVRQVRYRSPTTGTIERVEPDRVLTRRR